MGGYVLQALAILREHNQDAFFGLLAQNLNELLPVIYTPTVGDACKNWSALMQRPQGLYVSIKDKVISKIPWNNRHRQVLHASMHASCCDSAHSL